MTATDVKDIVHPSFQQEILRSPWEGGGWEPHWRFQLAMQYAREAKQAQAQSIPWAFPRHETDQIVADFFQAAYYGVQHCPNPETAWAYRTWANNSKCGIGSRIKAMAVAGLTAARIGDLVHGTERAIATFLAAFFDIDQVKNNPNYIAAIVFPFQAGEYDGLSEDVKRERYWITVAWLRKWEGLRLVLEKPLSTDKADMEEMMSIMRAALTSQATEYALNMRSFGMPRPTDFEKLMSLQQSQAAVDAARGQGGGDAGQLALTIFALLNDGAQKALLPENKANELTLLTEGAIDIDAEVITSSAPGAAATPRTVIAPAFRPSSSFPPSRPSRNSLSSIRKI
jgi:hypothetical protein